MTANQEQQYYIVREGTNIRATTRDREPTIVRGLDRAWDIAQGYEDVVRPKVGNLHPIRVEDYHARYDDPHVERGERAVPRNQATEEHP